MNENINSDFVSPEKEFLIYQEIADMQSFLDEVSKVLSSSKEVLASLERLKGEHAEVKQTVLFFEASFRELLSELLAGFYKHLERMVIEILRGRTN